MTDGLINKTTDLSMQKIVFLTFAEAPFVNGVKNDPHFGWQ